MSKRTITVLTGLSLIAPNAAFAIEGANLFETRCSLCHQTKEIFSDLDAARIRSVLQSDAVTEHRFVLSAEEINAIVSHLKGVKQGD